MHRSLLLLSAVLGFGVGSVGADSAVYRLNASFVDGTVSGLFAVVDGTPVNWALDFNYQPSNDPNHINFLFRADWPCPGAPRPGGCNESLLDDQSLIVAHMGAGSSMGVIGIFLDRSGPDTFSGGFAMVTSAAFSKAFVSGKMEQVFDVPVQYAPEPSTFVVASLGLGVLGVWLRGRKAYGRFSD